MISKATIQKIKDEARVEDVVGEFVTLKKRGANLLGLCPFHNEKTPSFNVNPARNIYKCFGCGKAGGPTQFLMDYQQMSYPRCPAVPRQKIQYRNRGDGANRRG